MPDAFDPKAVLSSEEVLKYIEKVSNRRFKEENEADECYVYILDRLEDDDFRRVRQFKGKSSFKTYLHTLINSLAIDFQRERYGRMRVPKSVTKLGPWAENVYKLLCWKHHSLQSCFDLLCIDGCYSQSFECFLAEVESIPRAPCKASFRFAPVDDPEETLEQLPDEEANPLEELLARLDHERRTIAGRIIREVTSSFSEEDKLLVRLRFGRDQKYRKIAIALNCSERELRERLRSILTRYRARLLAEGIREF